MGDGDVGSVGEGWLLWGRAWGEGCHRLVRKGGIKKARKMIEAVFVLRLPHTTQLNTKHTQGSKKQGNPPPTHNTSNTAHTRGAYSDQ